MAVDTQNKRRSVAKVLPVPNSEVDLYDRAQVSWLYSGLAAVSVFTGQFLRLTSAIAQKLSLTSDIAEKVSLESGIATKISLTSDLEVS